MPYPISRLSLSCLSLSYIHHSLVTLWHPLILPNHILSHLPIPHNNRRTPLNHDLSLSLFTPLTSPYTLPRSWPVHMSSGNYKLLSPANTTKFIRVMVKTPALCTIPNPHIPHPINHTGTHNTALLQTYLSTTTRLSHIHQFRVPLPYLHRAMQELKHEHTICLRAHTALCDTTSLYLND